MSSLKGPKHGGANIKVMEMIEYLSRHVSDYSDKDDPDEEEGVKKTLGKLRMAITPYYLSLIDPEDPYDPIRRQAVPSAEELYFAPEDQRDPLHEDADSPCTGLTHRYPDRVLFLVSAAAFRPPRPAFPAAPGFRVPPCGGRFP